MPPRRRCMKGRLSGDSRKEINTSRISEIFKLFSDIQKGKKNATDIDFAFARVIKMLGANHVRVMIDGAHGPRELTARIPNIYSRKGATPITTSNVVTIYTGTDFENYTPTSSDQFDITTILSLKDMQRMRDTGYLSEWMLRDADTIHTEGIVSTGYEFDYSGMGEAESEEDDDEDSPAGGAGAPTSSATPFTRGSARERSSRKTDDADVDVEAI